MIAIIISACLVTNPGVCRDYRVPLASQADVGRCLVEAPPHFARWSEEHPNWAIKRWRCSQAGTHDL